jgi:hypothetical protein
MLIETLTATLGLGALLALAAPTRMITTEIDIPATPQDVWQVLADGAAYADWNPFIRHLSGDLQTGGRIKITIQPKGQKAMTFHPASLPLFRGRNCAGSAALACRASSTANTASGSRRTAGAHTLSMPRRSAASCSGSCPSTASAPTSPR